jgi:hypothetical protein
MDQKFHDAYEKATKNMDLGNGRSKFALLIEVQNLLIEQDIHQARYGFESFRQFVDECLLDFIVYNSQHNATISAENTLHISLRYVCQ